jgi:hypothetical protein
MKEDEAVIFRVLMLIVVGVISIIVGFVRHRGIQAGEPLAFGIAFLFFILYLLWEWKASKIEFIKRCILAAPLAVVPAIAGRIVGFDIVLSVYVGGGTLLFLVMKTSYWKRHFLVTLTASLVFTFLLASVRHELSGRDPNIYKVSVIFGLALFFGTLYGTYLYVMNSPKLKAEHPIAIKLLMFAGLIFLGCILVGINHIMSIRYHISFVISFGISVLIALGLLWLCRLFGITSLGRSEESKTKIREIRQVGVCDCCGKTGIPQELLFKIDSGQRVCANCLKKMEQPG